jgi:exodeoxyribonuclease VII small subunit
MAGRSEAGGTPPSAGEEISFETALERLETIVEELEGGALTLEESIARYEEGVQLSRRLTQTLDQAEKRIERLVQHELASPPTTTPMELEENNGAADAEPGADPRGADPGPARRAPRIAPAPRSERPPAERTADRGPFPPDELPF